MAFVAQNENRYDFPAIADTVSVQAAALNIPPDPAHTHRLRVYPLKDRAGALVPHSYLLGWEGAGNADYNDYIFILKNVAAAP